MAPLARCKRGSGRAAGGGGSLSLALRGWCSHRRWQRRGSCRRGSAWSGGCDGGRCGGGRGGASPRPTPHGRALPLPSAQLRCRPRLLHFLPLFLPPPRPSRPLPPPRRPWPCSGAPTRSAAAPTTTTAITTGAVAAAAPARSSAGGALPPRHRHHGQRFLSTASSGGGGLLSPGGSPSSGGGGGRRGAPAGSALPAPRSTSLAQTPCLPWPR